MNYSKLGQLLLTDGGHLPLAQFFRYPLTYTLSIFFTPEGTSARDGWYEILVDIRMCAYVHGIAPAAGCLKSYNRNAILHCG